MAVLSYGIFVDIVKINLFESFITDCVIGNREGYFAERMHSNIMKE